MTRSNNTTQPGNRAVGYVRRFTDRQEQSIPDQKKTIEAYVAEHGLRLVKFYIDDAISGTSTLGRRAFQKMIQDAQKSTRRFDKIIVYDVKRFGRIDNDEAGYYRHILRTNSVEVIYVTENFNGDSTDDLLRPVKQWQARQESKDLSKVTIRGLLSKVEGGWWMGGTPPYGYDLRYQNAEDIAQNAMLKGFVEIEKLRDSSQFGSWILRIAKNMCINLIRRRKHRRQITAAKAMQTRQQAEQDDVLWHAIERLSQEYRLSLVMYYFDGESVEKVADGLSISRSGAHRKIRSAVRQLHKLLIREE